MRNILNGPVAGKKRLFCLPAAGILLVIKGAERATTGATLIAGLGMYGNDSSRELDVQIGFQMIGKVVGVQNRCRAGHDEMKFNKYIRSLTFGPSDHETRHNCLRVHK